MGKKFTKISKEVADFIESQKIFFVGTAAQEGRVNVSPKGMDTFRIIDSNKVVWLNLTGSGNETAAHLLQNDRMTIMFCAFEGKPMIVRLYGFAKMYYAGDTVFEEHINDFPTIAGTRQIAVVTVDLVQTSCGMSVPFMDFKEERTQLQSWAEKKGEDKLIDYRKEKNQQSIDGFETGLPV